MKSFLNILCDFLLKVACDLYYKGLYLWTADANRITSILTDTNISAGADFSFDRAFSYAVSLESNIRTQFEKMLELEYPTIDPSSIIKK